MSDLHGDRLHTVETDFSLRLKVSAQGGTPGEIRANATREAARFFGDDALLAVVSAEVEEDLERSGLYNATVVFRQVTT
jgi:hypothetical protein